MAQHVRATSLSIDFDGIKVLANLKRKQRRKIREAIGIKKRLKTLNTQDNTTSANHMETSPEQIQKQILISLQNSRYQASGTEEPIHEPGPITRQPIQDEPTATNAPIYKAGLKTRDSCLFQATTQITREKV